MKPSLSHVAKQAGVSSATVSRVLSGSRVRIAPETRQRVQEIANDLGYAPNRAARALVTGRTQTLALWAVNLRSPFSAQVIYNVSQELARHEYDLMIAAAQSSHSCLKTAHLLSWPIDGIFALDLPRAAVPGLNKSLLGGKPFVSLGGYISQESDYVHVDFQAQVMEAIRHLFAVGCRRIAYLVPDWFEWFRHAGDPRLCGYDTVICDAGKKPEYIAIPDERRRSVAPALTEYINCNGCPDGLFCFNDDMAIGAYRALKDLGRRIPDDVALIGCDGIEDTLYFDPPITTIAQPLEQMCMVAWAFLERRIRDNDLPLQQITVQPRLEIRQSSRR
ncbi:MAG TPA: LacI family DNA-binding transcriptional regulator [Capsulimonadaceae bacterium]|nr:LacI family DNA-binding transcriptional regulator [Capsulimonadaceae bacterium]